MLIKDMRVRLAGACLFFMLFSFPCAAGPAISGFAERPFPALMTVDYPYSRARAWIGALVHAGEYIPDAVKSRLRSMNLDSFLARLALCALACPLASVTPENAGDGKISVLLQPPLPGAFIKVLENPEKFVTEMALIHDLQRRVNLTANAWPKSLAEAREKIPRLESLAKELDALWGLLMDNQQDKSHDGEFWTKMTGFLADSPLVWLKLAQDRNENQKPQAALEAARAALYLCSRLPQSARIKFISAQIRHERALAHLRLFQPALAQADLEAARDLLRETGLKSGLTARILLAHAELALLKKDFAAMCDDYLQACALGHCKELAQARRNGQCLPKTRLPRKDAPLTEETIDSYMP